MGCCVSPWAGVGVGRVSLKASGPLRRSLAIRSWHTIPGRGGSVFLQKTGILCVPRYIPSSQESDRSTLQMVQSP